MRAVNFFCTFLCRCFARVQPETSRNFLVTRFIYGEKSSTCSHSLFFSLPLIQFYLHDWLQNFHVVLPTKKSPLFFSCSRFLLPIFLLRFTGLSPTFSFSLSFSCSIFHITCGLSLLLQTTRAEKQFSLSVFVFIDSLVVSALQDRGAYAIFRQNNLEYLPYLSIELFHIGMPVVRTDGRSVRRAGVRSRDYCNFSDGQITKFSYPWCSAAGASRARELRF